MYTVHYIQKKINFDKKNNEVTISNLIPSLKQTYWLNLTLGRVTFKLWHENNYGKVNLTAIDMNVV